MAEQDYYPERPRGILYRLIQALTGILILACLVSGYLGLRAIVWRHNAELPALLSSGLTVAFAIGIVLGGLYLIFGAQGMRFVLNFNWMSVQLGLVLGMLLYGLFNALFPLLPTYAREDFFARALQGAVDGALIGALTGAIVSIVNRKPVILTRPGVVRYSLIFLLTLAAMAAVIAVGNEPSVPRNLTPWLILPVILILRVLVGIYDRWIGHRRGSETYDEWTDYTD
ncbi:MAG: hypothetical protein IT320_16345 [Anaerolineae bacterium]|nr:hypothetical protein [Anaerolineae bacterium]